MLPEQGDVSAQDVSALSQLGEFGVIARLTQGLESRPDVLLGVGDDAALLDIGSERLLVATCDAQVEGKHFLRSIATFEEIGHKALAVNLSDIAAMGAEPCWALVSLLIPNDLTVASLERIYAGMRALARQYSVALVGGNISSTTGPLCLDITLLGMVARKQVVRRSGAQVGDVLLLTGEIGTAAAGIVWSTTASYTTTLSQAAHERTRQALVAPHPCVVEGQALAASGLVTAMLDISDGLGADLAHLCEASHLGAILEADAIPIDRAAVEVATAYGRDPLELALYGGEDYVLLCTVGHDHTEEALATIAEVGGTGQVIGHMVAASEGMRLHRGLDHYEPIERRGWDHLR